MKAPFDKKFWLFMLAGVVVVIVGEAVVIFWSLAWYWAVAIFIPAFVCFGYVASQHQQQLFEEHFRGRPALNENEFGQHYFLPDRAEIATKLRKILANHVGIDLSRMNPTDRFIEDLRMDDFDSLSTVNFVIEIEKEFGIKIPDAAAEKMLTFQSVVDYVDEAVKAKAV
jgi:acyl carrier protein